MFANFQIFTKNTSMLIAILLLMPVCNFIAYSDEFYPLKFNHDNYPEITIDGILTNQEKVVNISSSSLIITENGEQRSVSNVQCSESNPTKRDFNLLIVIDFSSSMKERNYSLIKLALKDIFRNYNFGNSRIAISGFNNSNFLIHDFSNDAESLSNSLDNLQHYGSSDLESAFINSPAGAYNLFKSASVIKEAILISDGSETGNFDAISDSLTSIGIRLNSLTMDFPTSSIVTNLTKKLNGYSIGNIENYEELVKALKSLVFLAEYNSVCQISYNSFTCMQINSVNLNFTDLGISRNISFEIPKSKFPSIKIVPNYFYYGMRLPPSKQQQKFEITAMNGDIDVIGYDDNAIFKVISEPKSFKLRHGETKEIIVEFIPIDSTYVFREISILGNHCEGGIIKLAGGSDRSLDIDKTIKVISPNGGEYLQSGGSATLQWSGTLPSDTVKIDYSINNGNSWINLTNIATGLNYNWNLIPNTLSNNCLLKVSQLSKYDLSKNIISLKGMQGNVVNIVWRDSQNELYTGSTDGFIRLWNASSGEPTKTVKGGINNLLDFDLSPNFNYVAYLTQSSSILTVLNLNNEFDINEIDFKGEELVKLDWNTVNNYLAIVTASGKVYILDYPDETAVKILDFSDLVSSLEWSRNGQRLAIGYNSGNCKVFSMDNDEVFSIKASDQKINSVAFNPTGNFLITASMNEFIRVWDINNSSNITSFNNIKKPVNSVAWDPTALYVASASVDSSITLWNPGNGNIHYTFRGHNSNVNKILWRNDGKRIASSTNQGEVFIWSPDDIPFTRPTLQEDTSDKVWSIVNPQLESKAVVFAPIRIYDSIDSTVFGILVNPNNYDIVIDSIFIKSNNSPFVISSKLPKFPLVIKAKSSFDLQLRFNPVTIGARIDTIIYLSGLREFKTSLFGFSTEKLIEISPKYHDFGVEKIGNNSDPFTFEIKNISSSPIFVEDIFPIINDSGQFKVINFEPGFIQSNESKFIEIIYIPSKFSASSALFDVIYDGKSGPDYISLIGAGAAPQIRYQPNFKLSDLVCENSFMQIIKILNIGNEKLKINSITLSDNASNDFSLDLSSTNFEILENDSTSLVLNYSGNTPGVNNFQIIINSEINADKTTINLIDINFRRGISGFKLFPSSLAYYVFEKNTSDSRTLKIINTGTEPINWLPPNGTTYFIVDSILPERSAPGDTSIAYVRFIGANDEGFYSDQIIFKDSCGNTSTLNVSAYVGPSDAVLTASNIIEFPEVYCKPDTIISKISITNEGTTPLVVTSMELKSGSSNFFILDEIPAFSIESGEQIDINIGFFPNKAGLTEDSLIISTNAKNYPDGKLSAYLSAFYGSTDFSLSDELIEINGLLPSESFSSSFKILNTGSMPIEWSTNEQYEYLTIDSIRPEIAQPGDLSTVYFSFIGGLQDRIYSQIIIFNTLCNNPDSLEIIASVDGSASVIIKIGNEKSKPGDTTEIPIFLIPSRQNELPEVSFYTATIQFNSTLLVPLSDIDTYVQNGIRYMNLTIPSKPINADSKVATLKFLATLGNQDSTIIKLHNSKAADKPEIKILEMNGSFSLDGLSYDGGVRLIGNSGRLQLEQNAPNPVTNTTKIKFSVIETGIHSISIYNLIGNSVKLVFSEFITPGKYQIEFSLDDLPIGNYIYKLSTPTTSLIRKMTVNR